MEVWTISHPAGRASYDQTWSHGIVEVFRDQGAGQIWPGCVEVTIDGFHPGSLGGVPSTGMEILNVLPEGSGLISCSAISALCVVM